MRKLIQAMYLAGWLSFALPLAAQQVCPGLPYVVNTPEDELMLAVNGAETPQEQVAALDKFAQTNSESRFMPCVYELYTIAYLKLNDYDKVIEYGEKGLSGNYQDVMTMLNLTKAYVASGRVSDSAFDVIMKAQQQITSENTPARHPNVSDEEWQKAVQEAADQAKDQRTYVEYAFFQLLQRVTEAPKRLELLDRFTTSYPESTNVAQINFNYFLAHKMANDGAKAAEYGEKAVAADPTNVITLNLVADEYATRQTNLDKAEGYARKALDLAPTMKKPEGMSDDQFKSYQDSQVGLAHLSLGYIAYQRDIRTKKLAPAIQEFKMAVDLLGGNPVLQGRALFYLGYAYEAHYPPNHKLAADALTRAVAIPSPWQGEAQKVLADVKKALGQ